MKVLLCSLNAKYIHSSLAPWCLLAGLEAYADSAVKAEVIEGTVNQPVEVIAGRLLEAAPDVVGFSCTIWNIQSVKRLIVSLKAACPQTVVVLGGPEATFRAEELLSGWPEVSYINAGEGERPFAQLVNALLHGENPVGIPGLCYRRGTQLVVSPPYVSTEDPPSPYTARYFAALGGRIAYLETSRGCPFSCAFCLSGRGESVRFFNLERAKADILRLAASGTRTIKLVDRTFNCCPARTHALLSFILEHAGREISEGVCFHLEVAADLFDKEGLALLKAAPPGLFQVEAGLQSFHTPTLEAVTRRTNLARLYGNLEKLLEPGNVHVHIDLIAGLPYEDLETFAVSFDKAFDLRPHMLQLGFLKLLHGSRLRREAADWGIRFNPEPPYEIVEGRWLTGEDIIGLHWTEDALERLYNSGRFRLTVEYLLKALSLRPFRLFQTIGEAIAARGGVEGISLDAYTALLWEIVSGMKGVNPAVLRDALVCDSLRSRRGGQLPACLYQADRRLPRLSRVLAAVSGEKGIKRGVALLESRPGLAAVAPYTHPDPVTGWYPLQFICLEEYI